MVDSAPREKPVQTTATAVPDPGVPAEAVPRCEAAADRPLMEAYLRAVYRLSLDGGPVDIAFHRFEVPAAADEGMPVRLPEPWAFMTAYNPMSCPLDDDENRARDAELEREVRAVVARTGARCVRAEGRAPEGDWREPGWCLVGVRRGDALALGRAFGQRAILWGAAGRAGVLDCRTEAWTVRPLSVRRVDSGTAGGRTDEPSAETA